VMSNFNTLLNCSNNNLAHNGANSDITQLTGITTPLTVPQGGTGLGTLTANGLVIGNGTSTPSFLATSTTDSVPIWNGTAWSASGGLPSITVYASGSGTYTTPTGATWLEVKMAGGGAGGWSSSDSTSPVAPGSGGNTTLGTSLLAANGGTAAVSANASSAGGTASGGDINITGQTSTNVTGDGVSDPTSGGPGGSTGLGLGLGGAPGFGSTASAATGHGGGGGGSGGSSVCGNAVGGGAGGALTKIILSPAASYAYAVGIAGTAGTGTGCYNGAAGTAGIIEIIAHFGN